MDNCLRCDSLETCLSCEPVGFFYNGTVKKCSRCSAEHCIDCRPDNVCSKCADPFEADYEEYYGVQVMENKCVKVANLGSKIFIGLAIVLALGAVFLLCYCDPPKCLKKCGCCKKNNSPQCLKRCCCIKSKQGK